ncbi:MAG: phage tail sheath C-terminal domain-containing protein, partial [Pseudomonadota bacterium]|nr:phage tail sheath C-terminal domain-containing protein [Pseudomonadota bacterium]
YIEEVSTGAKPIAAVGTSTAAFIGCAPDGDAHLNEAVAVNNRTQFIKEFVRKDSASTHLAQAVIGFFDNGGGRCYIVNVGPGNPIAGDVRQRTGITCLEEIDEVAIVAAPGFADPMSYDALLSHCEKLGDRFAILDCPESVDNIDLLKQVATAQATPAEGGEAEDAEKPSRRKGSHPPSGMRPRNSDGGFGAFYFPWITARDPMAPSVIVRTPPSGHLAGLYAQTDAKRGVHKAPANMCVSGALGLTYRVTREEQGELNKMGVNCIRFFPDAGIRVWGARTLADEASEWRYINVRRLFNMIEESIGGGTRWTVFEPNDQRTWKSVERDIRAFLTLLWRDGALKGETPEQAFFVKCDAETNPPDVIDAGRLITEIGIAPVKPAEFIIFRIGQWAGGAETEESAES